MDLLHVLLALAPVAILLVILVGLRWSAAKAGLVGAAVAGAVAWAAFRLPPGDMAVAIAKGAWDALYVLYVVWPSLLFYHVASSAGAFDALRAHVRRVIRDRLFLVLAFGWVFASFLQGVAGFGAPVAVVAPLLVAIGVPPMRAVVIPLIGHSWATVFGTLGLGWLATLRVVALSDPAAAAFQAGLLLWCPNLAGGLAIAWLVGGKAALRHGWPLVLVLSALLGGGQLAIVPWNPPLSALLAATAAMVALYPLSRWRRYRETAPAEDAAPEAPAMSLGWALLPYAALTLSAVAVLTIEPVNATLSRFELGFALPAVETGYGVSHPPEAPYAPIAPLTHPGAFLVLAAAVSAAGYRLLGRVAADRKDQAPLWRQVAKDAGPASLAVLGFLVMSTLMGQSGQTLVLAWAIAEATSPAAFAVASVWLGALGALMTSSATASNILFAPLQDTVAGAEPTLDQATVIGAQSAGAAIGNATGPANVVLGAGTAGVAGQEGDILRRVLPWAGVTALVTSGLSLGLYFLAGG